VRRKGGNYRLRNLAENGPKIKVWAGG